MLINLDEHELKAVIFAVKSDLETVNNDIEEYAGEDEILLSALQKLEEVNH